MDDHEGRVSALERWREEVDPQLRALVSLDISHRMDDLETALANMLGEWKRIGADIHAGADKLLENAALMKQNADLVKMELVKLNDNWGRFMLRKEGS